VANIQRLQEIVVKAIKELGRPEFLSRSEISGTTLNEINKGTFPWLTGEQAYVQTRRKRLAWSRILTKVALVTGQDPQDLCEMAGIETETDIRRAINDASNEFKGVSRRDATAVLSHCPPHYLMAVALCGSGEIKLLNALCQTEKLWCVELSEQTCKALLADYARGQEEKGEI